MAFPSYKDFFSRLLSVPGFEGAAVGLSSGEGAEFFSGTSPDNAETLPGGRGFDLLNAEEKFNRFFGAFSESRGGGGLFGDLRPISAEDEALKLFESPPKTGEAEKEAEKEAEEEVAGSPPVGGVLSFEEAAGSLEKAGNVKQAVEALLAYGRGCFSRQVLFVTKSPKAFAYRVTGEGLGEEAARELELSLAEPSIFRLLDNACGYYLGPIPKTPVNDSFVKVLGGERPCSALIIPILIEKRVVNLLYGDNGPFSEVAPNMTEWMLLTPKVSAAYERFLETIRRGRRGGAR